MARSRWKLVYFSSKVWRFFLKKNKKNKKTLKNLYLFDRSSTLPTSLINTNVFIHKGNSFKTLLFKKYFFGKKMGEFSFTKKPFFFPLKKKKR